MGRIRKYRQRLSAQADTLQAKTLYGYLVSDLKKKWELSRIEAEMLADDVVAYFRAGGLKLLPAQVKVLAIDRRGKNGLQRDKCLQKEITLTVYADEDRETLAEHGVASMQAGRVCRWVEEAYLQDAVLDRVLLSQMITITDRALRKRFARWHKLGIKLPVGIRRNTEGLLRPAWLVRQYLKQQDFSACCRELGVSEGSWRRWWKGFLACEWLRREGVGILEAAGRTGWAAPIVAEWYEVGSAFQATANELLEDSLVPVRTTADVTLEPQGRLQQLLQERYGFRPAACDRFLEDIAELARNIGIDRQSGQILYIAVSQGQTPGESLADSELVTVTLDYLHPDDVKVAKPDSTAKLKWQRLMRLAYQAHEQGGCLTQADLAFLMGISVEAIQAIVKAHDTILLPTRGQVADMGSNPSHAEKILTLYMNGYTETQITQRTGHSYASVERYLVDFARVVVLVEHGLPLPVLRKVLGRSQRVVKRYLELYRRFNHSDYAFTMARIRQIGRAHHPKGPSSRKDGGTMKQIRKGNRYASLPKKQVEPVQKAQLRKHFELAAESVKADAAVRKTNQVISQWEASRNIRRVAPGQIVIDYRGTKAKLPLLTPYWAKGLAEGAPPKLVKRQLEQEQLAILRQLNPEARITDLWRWVNQWELCRRKAPDTLIGILPHRNPDHKAVAIPPRYSTPGQVIDTVGRWLMDKHGCPEAQAEALVEIALQVRNRCMPLLTDLQAGQAVWLARALRKTRGLSPEDLQPVVLTLLTEEELSAPLEHREHGCQLKLQQLERITIEAFRQNAVLTMLDLELLLNVSASVIKRLLDRYYQAYSVLLPTAGSVLDMGTTLTHKSIVVEQFLAGKTSEEIAGAIYHTNVAVDRYIGDFENYMTLTYYEVPEIMLPRILGKSESLMQEYKAILSKHFPEKQDIQSYLTAHGLIPSNSSGS